MFDDSAAGRGAGLAGQAETGLCHQRRGQIKVGIGQDDGGIFSAHFHLGARHALGELKIDLTANGIGAGKRERSHAWVRRQFSPHLAPISYDHVQHAFGQPRFIKRFGQLKC